MTHINLYGIPYRSWVVMRNLTRVAAPDTDRLLGTSQFSSQERNQAEDFGSLLHSVHDDFHSYFVVVVVVLAAAISALVFMAIILTLHSYCSCSVSRHASGRALSRLASCHRSFTCSRAGTVRCSSSELRTPHLESASSPS